MSGFLKLTMLVLVVSVWGCSTNTDVGTVTHQVQALDGSEDDFVREWDTGYLDTDEQCVFMTRNDCLAVNGKFSTKTVDKQCVEGEVLQCCIADVLTNPCQEECTHGSNDCTDRNGTVLPTGRGYGPDAWECSGQSDKCCENPDPIDTDMTPFGGEPFDPETCESSKNCPSDTDIVTPDLQPDKLASGICMQMKNETSGWFCPQDDYERIVDDVAAIKSAYFKDVPYCLFEHVYNGFDDGVSPFRIMCVAGAGLVPKSCTDFPKDQWQELLDGLGANRMLCLSENNAANTCGQVHFQFEVGTNTKRMLPIMEEHAKSLVPGSVCNLNSYVGVTLPRNGFHPTVIPDSSGDWQWEVRVTAEHSFGTADCDLRLTVTTTTSGDLNDLLVDNQNAFDSNDKPLCNTPGFELK